MSQLLHRLACFLRLPSARGYSYPALDLSLPGERHFHLVGSIHMGTVDMTPLPRALLNHLLAADQLIVEADITTASAFPAPLDHPPLAQRLSPELYQQLQQRCRESGNSLPSLSTLPCWQVALSLQAGQAKQLGLRPDYGIDYQLLQAARQQQTPIMELEGVEQQFSLLQQLPQDGQVLLEDTLLHWHTNARLLQILISWWLATPPRHTVLPLPTTFSSTLFDVMMSQRNRQWQKQLQALPAGRYVVAVGALHLYGAGNLPQLLRQHR